MAVMSDLTVHIREYACEDGRVENLLTWIINEHIQGRVKFKDMPKDAQCCYGLYEQETQLMQDADQQAEQWEKQHRIDVHNKIKWAVENGQLTDDQGLELINDNEKADKWVIEGIL
jgi:hypothetical protein